MLFFVRTVVDVITRANLRRESERSIHYATDRFQDRIREVGVVLSDVNGPRGGLDKQVRLVVTLRRGGTLEIEETRQTFLGAIRHASRRLRNLLARRIGGKRPASSFRRGFYRRPWNLL